MATNYWEAVLKSFLPIVCTSLVVRHQWSHWQWGASSRKESVGHADCPSPQWSLGTSLGTGLGLQGGGPGIRQGRAMGSWRLTLLWLQLGRGWQPWGWHGCLGLVGSGEPPGGQEQAGLAEPSCLFLKLKLSPVMSYEFDFTNSPHLVTWTTQIITVTAIEITLKKSKNFPHVSMLKQSLLIRQITTLIIQANLKKEFCNLWVTVAR